MTARSKDILLAAGCMLGIHLLYWPVTYFSTVSSDPVSVFSLFAYWFVLFPAYFVVRGFSKQKGIFWIAALGFHILGAVLSRWALAFFISERYISGWDDFTYIASWLFVAEIVCAALFLDLIILIVKWIIKKLMNKRKKAPITECAEDSDENET